jgi:hypothetical protein
LFTYLTDRVGALAAVERVETAAVTSYVKRFAPAQDRK